MKILGKIFQVCFLWLISLALSHTIEFLYQVAASHFPHQMYLQQAKSSYANEAETPDARVHKLNGSDSSSDPLTSKASSKDRGLEESSYISFGMQVYLFVLNCCIL